MNDFLGDLKAIKKEMLKEKGIEEKEIPKNESLKEREERLIAEISAFIKGEDIKKN